MSPLYALPSPAETKDKVNGPPLWPHEKAGKRWAKSFASSQEALPQNGLNSGQSILEGLNAITEISRGVDRLICPSLYVVCVPRLIAGSPTDRTSDVNSSRVETTCTCS